LAVVGRALYIFPLFPGHVDLRHPPPKALPQFGLQFVNPLPTPTPDCFYFHFCGFFPVFRSPPPSLSWLRLFLVFFNATVGSPFGWRLDFSGSFFSYAWCFFFFARFPSLGYGTTLGEQCPRVPVVAEHRGGAFLLWTTFLPLSFYSSCHFHFFFPVI